MKRSLRIALFSLAALLSVEAASAQQVTQSISLRVPEFSALAITNNAVTLEMAAPSTVNGEYASVSNSSTMLTQLNNYASAQQYLRISASLDAALPDGLALTVSASGTGGQSSAALGGAATPTVVNNITRGLTEHTLTYTLSATADAPVYELNDATVTYTVVAQ